MKIVIASTKTPAYDPDDYTQPWIGRVVEWETPNEFPLIQHGAFVRDEANRRGSSGRLEIPVFVDGVVLHGMRAKGSGANRQTIAIARPDGSLEAVEWREAWEQWRDVAQYLPRGLPAGPWVEWLHHSAPPND